MSSKKKLIALVVVSLGLVAIVGYSLFNRIYAQRALSYLSIEDNCASVAQYNQPELNFLNAVEAYYMSNSTIKSVSATGSIYSIEAPNQGDVVYSSEFKNDYLTLYLEYLCDTYPIPSSEYLSNYVNDESYFAFIGSKSSELTSLYINALSNASMTTYDVINAGNAVESIHSQLFNIDSFINRVVELDEMIVLMDLLVENGDLSVITISDGSYQTSIDLTDSVIAELETYGEGITEGFEGESVGYIDLLLDNGEFTLSIDDYAIVMSKFDYIEENGYLLVRNFFDLDNLSYDELEDYAISMEYEGYEDMLNSLVHTLEGAIGNGYYETRVLSGYYEFDGVNVIFHTDSGVMNGVYNDGAIVMNLTVDGVDQELYFEAQ